MKHDTKSTQETKQESALTSKPISKPGMKTHLFKFILPGLLILLIIILIFRFAPVYREKQKDIAQYNMMAKKYRMVEFEFYKEGENPILSDERFKNHWEKEKFVREYNRLSEEIRSSPGLAKVRKLYNYLYGKYIDKKEYIEDKHCVMYLDKDSTYNNPSFMSLSQEKMEKGKTPWKICGYHENKFLRKHFLVELIFTGYDDTYEPNKYKGADIVNAIRIVAINKDTFKGYELSDNWGDWVKYNREKFRIVEKSEYDALDTHNKKIESFNQVVENEDIVIDSREKAKEYVEFFILMYYQQMCFIFEPEIEFPQDYHYREEFLGTRSFELTDKGEYYDIKFTTEGSRFTWGNNISDFEEIARWNVKLYRNGKLDVAKEIKVGGYGDEVRFFYGSHLM